MTKISLSQVVALQQQVVEVAPPLSAGADLDLIAANMYNVQRMQGETDLELRNRCMAKVRGYAQSPPQYYRDAIIPSETAGTVKMFKVRQKSTGLFWNGNRWATLEGCYAEHNAVSVDDEKELVELSPVTPPARDRMSSDQQAAMYNAVQQPIRQSVYTAGGGYAGHTAGKDTSLVLADPYDRAFPKQRHPNTGEMLVSGHMTKIIRGGKIGGMAVSGDCMYGEFETATGSSVAGYLHGSPGGTWQWDKVIVNKARSPF